MPGFGEGFQTDLGELQKAATGALPELSALLHEQSAKLAKETAFTGKAGARTDGFKEFSKAYEQRVDELVGLQRKGAERVASTARALQEIVRVYRRADGQK